MTTEQTLSSDDHNEIAVEGSKKKKYWVDLKLSFLF